MPTVNVDTLRFVETLEAAVSPRPRPSNSPRPMWTMRPARMCTGLNIKSVVSEANRGVLKWIVALALAQTDYGRPPAPLGGVTGDPRQI